MMAVRRHARARTGHGFRRPVAVCAVAGVLAAGVGGTLALWQAQASSAVALKGARHAFQARHLDGDLGSIAVGDGDVFDLTIDSAAVVDQLQEARSAYVPFRVYGAVQGGGVMTYQLTGVQGEVFAANARVALWRVDDAVTQCAAGALEGDRVYPAQGSYGPFVDLARDRFAVPDGDDAAFDLLVAEGSVRGIETGRHDYCLVLQMLGSYYENTATATGTTVDGLDVVASDSWDGTFVAEIPDGDATILHFDRSVGRGTPAVSMDPTP